MDWKTVTTDKLKDFGALKCAVNGIPTELHLIDCDIQKTRSAVANGLPAEAVEDIQLSRLMMRRELEWSLAYAKERVDDIEKAMNALDPKDREILDKLYVQPEPISVSRLSKEMYIASSTMYRKRDVALRKFAIALYGDKGS